MRHHSGLIRADHKTVVALQERLANEVGPDNKPLYAKDHIDGDIGPETVHGLQVMLKQKGYDLNPDKKYGDKTEAAVKDWAAKETQDPAAQALRKALGLKAPAGETPIPSTVREPHSDERTLPSADKTPKPFIPSMTPNYPQYADHTKPLVDPKNCGPFDQDACAKTLARNAHATSQHECAYAVRRAFINAGIKKFGSDYPEHAKQYDGYLEKNGFWEIGTKTAKEGYVPQKGDVTVVQPSAQMVARARHAGKVASGHISVYDGKKWVSDFAQSDGPGREGGIYPGPTYAAEKPFYKIYRHQNLLTQNDKLKLRLVAEAKPEAGPSPAQAPAQAPGQTQAQQATPAPAHNAQPKNQQQMASAHQRTLAMRHAGPTTTM